MDRFNITSFIVLNKCYYIIKQSITIILSVYYKKVYVAIIVKSKYFFVLIVILQPEIEQDKYSFFKKQFDSWAHFEKEFQSWYINY